MYYLIPSNEGVMGPKIDRNKINIYMKEISFGVFFQLVCDIKHIIKVYPVFEINILACKAPSPAPPP